MYFVNRFISETVTNGSIIWCAPKAIFLWGSGRKKPLLAVLATDSFVLIVCFLLPLVIS